MIRTLFAALAALTTLACSPAAAQTAKDHETFKVAVKAFTKSGRARLYQCKGPDGDYYSQTHHPERLVAIAKAMSAGDEIGVAERSGCRRSNDNGPTDAFSGEKLIAQATRDAQAVWLVGEVTESYPHATGYTFEGIVRIPMPTRPAAVTAASTIPSTDPAVAKADAEFYALRNTRTIRSTDESGFFVCPNQAALDAALDASRRLSAPQRDLRTADILTKNGCREGKGTITGIRVTRMVEGTDVTWHGSSAVAAGKRQPIVFWLF